MDTIQTTWESGVEQCDPWVLTAVQATMLGLSLLTAFFGYKLFRYYVAFWGFVVGAALVLPSVADQKTLLSAIVVLGCGAAAAALAFRFWRIGVFLGGGATGVVLAIFANSLQMPQLPIAAGAFVIAGLFAITYERFVLITATALSGSLYSLALGSALFSHLYSLDFIREQTLNEEAWTVLGVWAGFFAVAALVQWQGARQDLPPMRYASI